MTNREGNLLAAEGLCWRFEPSIPFLGPLAFGVPPGCLVVVIGPNGAGKTSLLRLLVGLMRPLGGTVTWQGQPLAALSPRERARRIAYLPQAPLVPPDLRVIELVQLGRHPHRSVALFESPDDRAVVRRAMGCMEIDQLAERTLGSLSGGERQRALLAATLAQETALLVLDEPTASLDLYHQFAIFDLLRKQTRLDGITVLTVVHDPNLAAGFADQVLLMHEGQIVSSGEPAAVLEPDTLGRVYRVRFEQVAASGVVQAGADAASDTRKWLIPAGRLEATGTAASGPPVEPPS